jgi:hypothetical protein
MTANGKDHVTGGVGMRRKIVEEHVAGALGFHGGSGLTVGNFVERHDDGLVDGTTVV